MTEATMLEKAARALAAEDARDRGVDLYDKNSGLYVRLARAVLMAVREPDRAMIIAGNDEDGYYNDGTAFNAECSQHWRAMIDAILADGEGR